MQTEKILLFDGFTGLNEIASQVGSYKGLQVCPIIGTIDQKKEYVEKLKAYRIYS